MKIVIIGALVISFAYSIVSHYREAAQKDKTREASAGSY